MNLRQHNMVLISLLIIVCLICISSTLNIKNILVQISHDSYIRKPRLSGNFLGNEGVRINEVSLYVCSIKWSTIFQLLTFDPGSLDEICSFVSQLTLFQCKASVTHLSKVKCFCCFWISGVGQSKSRTHLNVHCL